MFNLDNGKYHCSLNCMYHILQYFLIYFISNYHRTRISFFTMHFNNAVKLKNASYLLGLLSGGSPMDTVFVETVCALNTRQWEWEKRYYNMVNRFKNWRLLMLGMSRWLLTKCFVLKLSKWVHCIEWEASISTYNCTEGIIPDTTQIGMENINCQVVTWPKNSRQLTNYGRM